MSTQFIESADEQALVLSFTVDSRSDLDSKIEEGVRFLQKHAAHTGRCSGILVTRYSIRDFTVELHPAVPYGMTRERQSW